MTWTHNICDACWTASNPGRKASILLGAGEETCCFCGTPTSSGIVIRADPREEPVKSHCQCPQDADE